MIGIAWTRYAVGSQQLRWDQWRQDCGGRSGKSLDKETCEGSVARDKFKIRRKQIITRQAESGGLAVCTALESDILYTIYSVYHVHAMPAAQEDNVRTINSAWLKYNRYASYICWSMQTVQPMSKCRAFLAPALFLLAVRDILQKSTEPTMHSPDIPSRMSQNPFGL